MNLDKNYYKYEDNEVIQFKRGTSLALRRRNPVLLEGQPCIELDTLKFKIGDGKSKYNQLPYINKTNSGEGGADGLSAYEIWLELGNTGTEEDFINSLKGEAGEDGVDGKSAYEIWKDQGNTGTEKDFINSLKGKDGIDGNDGSNGVDGKSAYEIWLSLGNTGTEQDFIDSLKGDTGADGNDGSNGVDGKSAYEVWLSLGNTGTEQDFINSLKGDTGADGNDGKSAYEVWLSLGNTGTEQDFINSLKGDTGTDGNDGFNGKSAYEIWLELGNTGTEQDFIDSLKGKDGTDINSSDEKVKLNSTSTDSKYLEDLIDGATIKTDTTNNVIYVEKILGQTVTVAEINLLAGVTSNIQEQINNLSKHSSMYGVFDTKADLLASANPVPVDGNIAIVIDDESNNDVQMTYIYIESTSSWTQVSECTVSVRDFTVNPIDLSAEVTGTLPETNIDPSIARLDKVLDKDTYKGSTDGVVKSADTLEGLNHSVTEINDTVDNSHTHGNKELLDKLTSLGLGNKLLSDNGEYKEIITIGSTAPSDTSLIWVDNTDTSNPVIKIHDGTDWMTIGGASISITVDNTMSDESTNPVQNRVVKEYIDQKELVSILTLTEREW